jgi:hypothetical protein
VAAKAIRGPMHLMIISTQVIGMDRLTATQQIINNANTMPHAWMVLFVHRIIMNDVGCIHIIQHLTIFAALMRLPQDPSVHAGIIYQFDGDNLAIPTTIFAPTAIL